MSKLAMLVALFATIIVAQGFPQSSDTSIIDAASQKNWDLVHKLLSEQFNDKTIWEPNFPSGSVRSLKPPPGGHVYGTSEYQFHSSSNVNGKQTEESGGHKVINNDGKVEEYDFKPSNPTV